MDTVTSLLGNKIFASLYDPKADSLAADFRAKAATSLNGLTNLVSKGDATKSRLDKIPGVSDSTKASLESLLNEAKSYTSSVTSNLTPNAIAAKKDEVAAKIKALVHKAKGESATSLASAKEKEAKATQERIANQNASGSRLFKNILKYVLYAFLVIVLLALALWGGSLASNAAIQQPLYMRIYYLIYGFLLFPIPIFLSFSKPVTYHAVLAPLIERPLEPTAFTSAFAAFVFTPGILPQAVSVVANPTAVAQTNILKTISAEIPALPLPLPLVSVPSAAAKPAVKELMSLLSKNAGLIKSGVSV